MGNWYPSNNGSVVPGQDKRSEAYNEYNEPWMIDVNATNNWRSLRTINATDNWMYTEFISADFDEAAFDNPHWFEYYNVNDDPYQVDNLYLTLSDSLKKELHS